MLFCSPSVKTITSFKYVPLLNGSSCALAETSAALMCVPPLVGYVDVPYALMSSSICERTAVIDCVTCELLLNMITEP